LKQDEQGVWKMRFPVSLCNHFRTCQYDGCDKCDEYIRFIHEWQQKNKNSEKMVRRTVCDLKGLTNEGYDALERAGKI